MFCKRVNGKYEINHNIYKKLNSNKNWVMMMAVLLIAAGKLPALKSGTDAEQ